MALLPEACDSSYFHFPKGMARRGAERGNGGYNNGTIEANPVPSNFPKRIVMVPADGGRDSPYEIQAGGIILGLAFPR